MLSLLTLVWLKLLGKSHLQQHCESNQHFEYSSIDVKLTKSQMRNAQLYVAIVKCPLVQL